MVVCRQSGSRGGSAFVALILSASSALAGSGASADRPAPPPMDQWVGGVATPAKTAQEAPISKFSRRRPNLFTAG